MKRVKGTLAVALCVAGVAGAGLGAGPALADPVAPPADPQAADTAGVPAQPPAVTMPPPPPALPGDLVAPGSAPAAAETPGSAGSSAPVYSGAGVRGQNPTPFTGNPVFAPPSFNPVNGATVGVAKPIIINFQRPIANRALAEQAIRISSSPAVPGTFYWTTDTQVRWRPYNFWPAGTQVSIDASGTRSSFTVGESLIANINDNTKQMTITRNGVVEKVFPISMGMDNGIHETKNGTYYVLEKFPELMMDSSTYGVPVNSEYGYRIKVPWAVRIDNSGGFVHGAPWSVNDQGVRNVSHGCINLSPANAKWFYDNFGSGDPVIVKNSGGGMYTTPDGADDWQWTLY